MSEDTRYLLWPDGLRPPDVDVPDGYALRTSKLAGRDREAIEELLETGCWDVGIEAFRDRVLPNGSFVAVERATNAVVGTCSAIHEPNAGDHRFPFGAALAYLVVDPVHRREGLGRALSAAATRRLLDAGYDSVRVGVEPDRYPALALSLNAGYAPCILDENDVGRWRDVFDHLGLPFDPERCLRP
ncbi:GNAT family N-acetyltransferase [Halobacterium noricense]|uniref:GNAT family N-acetyltransferase n=1 Tax=Halobacterium noricense TaxID=223182 RepID=UPI001E3BC73D|nr:GNAT family N-acetyltransferase [Halobacterium noricense]UHH24257.1 GNAT family N-acetyltransferase [Halobacterium noricense]